MYRTTPVIASLRSKRGNLPNTTEVFVDERLPRRFAPRNDVVNDSRQHRYRADPVTITTVPCTKWLRALPAALRFKLEFEDADRFAFVLCVFLKIFVK